MVYCFLSLGSGCHDPGVADSDPDATRAILSSALDAWASGESIAELRRKQPPTYVADDLWDNGHALISYDLDPESKMVGPNVCFDVNLKTKSPNGQLQSTQLKYLVTAQPAQTIARLDQ